MPVEPVARYYTCRGLMLCWSRGLDIGTALGGAALRQHLAHVVHDDEEPHKYDQAKYHRFEKLEQQH